MKFALPPLLSPPPPLPDCVPQQRVPDTCAPLPSLELPPLSTTPSSPDCAPQQRVPGTLAPLSSLKPPPALAPLNLAPDGSHLTYRTAEAGPDAACWQQAEVDEFDRLFASHRLDSSSPVLLVGGAAFSFLFFLTIMLQSRKLLNYPAKLLLRLLNYR